MRSRGRLTVSPTGVARADASGGDARLPEAGDGALGDAAPCRRAAPSCIRASRRRARGAWSAYEPAASRPEICVGARRSRRRKRACGCASLCQLGRGWRSAPVRVERRQRPALAVPSCDVDGLLPRRRGSRGLGPSHELDAGLCGGGRGARAVGTATSSRRASARLRGAVGDARRALPACSGRRSLGRVRLPLAHGPSRPHGLRDATIQRVAPRHRSARRGGPQRDERTSRECPAGFGKVHANMALRAEPAAQGSSTHRVLATVTRRAASRVTHEPQLRPSRHGSSKISVLSGTPGA